MKICFIDWFAYALFNPGSTIVFGGAQIQLYLLARELSKNNAVYFLTDNQKINRVEKFAKIEVHQLLRGQWPFGYWQFFIRLLFELKKINADIFIQRAASTETGLLAVLVKLLGKKFIYMVAHERDVNGDFIRKNGWRGKLFSLGLKLADKIICQTKEQRSHLAKWFRGKSVVIASGYPIKVPNKMTKRIVLWVARAERWKNPELFLDLAKKFPQEKFTMICPPAENNPNYFKEIRDKAEPIPNLKFISRVPFNRIDNFFKKAKVFVSTSATEGFPNTFIQAGKNRVLIISFKVNPDKIIEKFQLGFCAQGDRGEMVRRLKQVLADSPLRRRLAINAFNYVRQHHDLTAAVARLQNLLKESVGNGKKSA